MSHAGTALIDPYKVFEKIALAPGMRVADLGCGRTGHFVFPAARAVGDTGIVYAVEIVKDILESIKSRARSEGYSNVQAVWSNVELPGKTPIPAQTLDACFIINALFFMRDKKAALAEGTRLLKSGGFLVIIDWLKKLGPLGPSPELMLPLESARQLAISVGLRPVDIVSVGEYHYCLIFKKS